MTNAEKLTKALNSYIAAFYEMAPTGGTAGYQQLHHNSARQFSEWKDGEFEDEHSTTGPIKLGANYWDNVSNKPQGDDVVVRTMPNALPNFQQKLKQWGLDKVEAEAISKDAPYGKNADFLIIRTSEFSEQSLEEIIQKINKEAQELQYKSAEKLITQLGKRLHAVFPENICPESAKFIDAKLNTLKQEISDKATNTFRDPQQGVLGAENIIVKPEYCGLTLEGGKEVKK